MSFDTGDRRQVERREKERLRRQRQLDEAFRWLMSDARGRLLMWERLTDAGVFRSSINPNPQMTAFAEGRRDLGLRDLAHLMRLCPEQYARMAAEASNPGENNERRDDTAGSDIDNTAGRVPDSGTDG